MAWMNPPFKGSNTTKTRIRGALLTFSMTLMWWCVAPVAGAQMPEHNTMQAITEISLERDCSGCATGSVLVLRRDGTATLTLTGKARMGTEDKVAKGAVRTQDFDALVKLALRQNFFALNDEYQPADVQDGTWTTTRVVRGTQDKRVFSREGAGPAGLQAFTAAIDDLQARIKFAP